MSYVIYDLLPFLVFITAICNNAALITLIWANMTVENRSSDPKKTLSRLFPVIGVETAGFNAETDALMKSVPLH